jgi:hypothetical protein
MLEELFSLAGIEADRDTILAAGAAMATIDKVRRAELQGPGLGGVGWGVAS